MPPRSRTATPACGRTGFRSRRPFRRSKSGSMDMMRRRSCAQGERREISVAIGNREANRPMTDLANELLAASDQSPVRYDRPPAYDGMVAEKDVLVPMRDAVKLAVDIYRPDTAEKLPALLAFSIYNKDLQGPDVAAALPPQPAWSSLWAGLLEAGDTKFLVSRRYIPVIGQTRCGGNS